MIEPVTFPVVMLENASPELKLMYALDQCMNFFQIDVNEKARAAQWLANKHLPVKSVE